VKKILNRRNIKGKPKYLVRWKKYTVKEDTWERLKSSGNVMELVKEFEKKIRREKIRRVRMRKQKLLNIEVEMFKKNELPEKYIAKILFE